MSEYKHCTDCRHYVPPDPPVLGKCHKLRSIVDGGPEIGRWSHPEFLRDDPWLLAVIHGTCGRTARWFEPKPQDATPQVTDALGLGNRSGWTGNLGGKP